MRLALAGSALRSALCALLLAAPTALVHAQSAPPQTVLYPGLEGEPLLAALRADFTPAQVLGYNPARDSLYAYEDRTDGALCGVYTQFCVFLTPGADPSTDAFNKGINAEHTWPQSMGAGAEPAKSDLHHLFPAKDNVNSSRSNHPYGEVPDAEADGWYRESFSQSTVPTVALDEWSEKDNDHPDPAFTGRFEPREDHAGDAARATFYFRAIYAAEVAAAGSEYFFAVQKDDLVRWHYQDAVSWEEYDRAAWIAAKQGANNPFLLDSTLARRAFGLPDGGIDDPGGDPGDPPPTGDPADVWVNEFHYDNDGTDTAEGVEVAGPAGTDLAGYALALYNGNGGTVYQTVALSGTLENQQGGYGTAWFPIAGLQNGSPDGLALVDATGAVVQFLSYEGVITAADGPAAGTTSVDVAVSETSATPTGHALQLGGTGTPNNTTSADFAWEPPQPATPGAPNPNQTLGDGTTPAPPVALWINEIHYDNAGADRNEGVEVAGTAGLDLAGYTLVAYNGSDGAPYATVALSGTVDDEAAGIGAVWFDLTGLQNGSPDGLALVDPAGAVVQFLSYEGTLTATSGPAAGLTSEDIGVAETSGTAKNDALQLAGTGTAYRDFAWAAPDRHTRGSVNRSQTFGAAARGADTASPLATAPDALPAESLRIYPNPTRSLATVVLDLDAAQPVRVEVYDVLGRRVAVLHDGEAAAGPTALRLDAARLLPGLYLVRVTSAGTARTERLTVLR